MERERGLFIVIEGIDGSGTTTQAMLLEEWFERRGLKVYRTYEPSPGVWGSLIRQVLEKRFFLVAPYDSQETEGQRERLLALLFALDRLDHLFNNVIPKLRIGTHVISDRYYLSTYAYQSLHVDLTWLMQLNSQCISPDLTILLNIPPEVCIKRIRKRRKDSFTGPSQTDQEDTQDDTSGDWTHLPTEVVEFELDIYEELDKLRVIQKNYIEIATRLAEEERIAIINFYDDSEGTKRGKDRGEIYQEMIRLVHELVYPRHQLSLFG